MRRFPTSRTIQECPINGQGDTWSGETLDEIFARGRRRWMTILRRSHHSVSLRRWASLRHVLLVLRNRLRDSARYPRTCTSCKTQVRGQSAPGLGGAGARREGRAHGRSSSSAGRSSRGRTSSRSWAASSRSTRPGRKAARARFARRRVSSRSHEARPVLVHLDGAEAESRAALLDRLPARHH